MTAPLSAGQHPLPLADVHAQLGPDGLRAHLAVDHRQPVDRRLGNAIAQQVHRHAHAEEA